MKNNEPTSRARPGKICLECAHCYVDPGWGGTDVTPGDPFTISCCKGHNIGFCGSKTTNRTLLDGIRRAETCSDFEEDNQ